MMDEHEKEQLGVGHDKAEVVPIEQFPYGTLEDAIRIHEAIRDADPGRAARAWKEVLYWLFNDGKKPPTGEMRRAKAVTNKVYALAWEVAPELFGNITLTDLAKSIGVSTDTLSHNAVEIRERFGFISQGMRATEKAQDSVRSRRRRNQNRDAAA